MAAETIRIEYTSLSELKRHPRNPKDHDNGAIAKSIERFGYIAPILMDERTGYVVAGHGRIDTLVALKEQGKGAPARIDVRRKEWYVPVVRGISFNSDHEVEAYLVADNRLTTLGGWNEPDLAGLLQELANEDHALFEATGFDDADLQALLDELTPPIPADDPGAQIDRAAELQQKWQTERGQLWTIGKHRLLCGDSTNAEDVARLMAGERADALINDPPYGMRLDADFSEMRSKPQFATEKKAFGGRKYDNVTGDHEDYDAVPVRELFQDVKEQFWFGADYYSASLGDTMHSGAWLVWDKRLDESADLMFGSCFELLWSAQPHKRDILRVKWAGIFGTEQEPEHQRFHPNHKPVALYTAILARTIPNAEVVLDCYGGAGSSMVACEQLTRQCRMMELEPKYCAVILERMSGMGITPELQA